MKNFRIMLICALIALSVCMTGCLSTPNLDETFTVTFNSNQGSAVDSQEVEAGGKATRPEDPTRADHVFDGWYLMVDLSGSAYTFEAKVIANITLNAKWIEGHTYVMNSISALPSSITANNKERIEEIRAIYESLSATAKAKVTTSSLEKLESAEHAIYVLEGGLVVELNAFIATLDEVVDFEDVLDYDSEEIAEILEMFDIFNAMSSTDKAKVTNANKLIIASAYCDSIEVFLLLTAEEEEPPEFESVKEWMETGLELIDFALGEIERIETKYNAYRGVLEELYEFSEYYTELVLASKDIPVSVLLYLELLEDVPAWDEFMALSTDSPEYLAHKENILAVWVDITSEMTSFESVPVNKILALELLYDEGAIAMGSEYLMGYYAPTVIERDAIALGIFDVLQNLDITTSYAMQGDYVMFATSATPVYSAYMAVTGEAKVYIDTYMGFMVSIFMDYYQYIDVLADEDLADFLQLIDDYNTSYDEALEAQIEAAYAELSSAIKAFVDAKIWNDYLSAKEYVVIVRIYQSFNNKINNYMTVEEIEASILNMDTVFAEYEAFYSSIKPANGIGVYFESPEEYQNRYFYAIGYSLEYYMTNYSYSIREDGNGWNFLEDAYAFLADMEVLKCAEDYFTEYFVSAYADALELKELGLIGLYEQAVNFEFTAENLAKAEAMLATFEELDEALQNFYAVDLNITFIELYVDYFGVYAPELDPVDDAAEIEFNNMVLAIDFDITPEKVDAFRAYFADVQTKYNEVGGGVHNYIYEIYFTAYYCDLQLKYFDDLDLEIAELYEEIGTSNEKLFENIDTILNYNGQLNNIDGWAYISEDSATKLKSLVNKASELLDEIILEFYNEYQLFKEGTSSEIESVAEASMVYDAVSAIIYSYYFEEMVNLHLLDELYQEIGRAMGAEIYEAILNFGGIFTFEQFEEMISGYGDSLIYVAFQYARHHDKDSSMFDAFTNELFNITTDYYEDVLEADPAVLQDVQKAVNRAYLLERLWLFWNGSIGDEDLSAYGNLVNQLEGLLWELENPTPPAE